MELEISADPFPFARSYQVEALEKAIEQNTIAWLETGTGKTLIAIMLLRSYACLLHKPSPFIAVFLVPQVALGKQQADAVDMRTDLNVGRYWGDMELNFWDGIKWKQEIDKSEVLVMTPQILLNGLRHGFFKLNMIKVLIFDECHHARKNHPYASIMKEFYHRQLQSGDLPRIFGMTASPIKSKEANSDSYWQKIHELETMMNSKVYTCTSDSVVSQYVPFSTPKFKFYQYMDRPCVLYARLFEDLNDLKTKHERSLSMLDLQPSAAESARNKISTIYSALTYCLEELGVCLALKAAEHLSCYKTECLMWEKLAVFGGQVIKSFCLDAFRAFQTCLPPAGSDWSIANNIEASVNDRLLTRKTFCLIESLLHYRELKDIRCIIFVERIITAIVLQSLLNEIFPKLNSWKTKCIAGNKAGIHNQTRKMQNEIVEEFRKGMVNIIVSTSILEEGIDVQFCNLVIRFDPSVTVSSFIQSRGRARMQNADYLLMVKSGDISTLSRLENYLASGDVMRKESLNHASLPCSPLQTDLYDEELYHVASTGACMTLTSSPGLINFYCSRLPSDSYFKPNPRCTIDKEMGICTLYLPKCSPVQTIRVQEKNKSIKTLKKKACFEACKKLHEFGALTDNLIPDIVVEEADAEEIGRESYNDDQPIFFPPELVNQCSRDSMTKYFCYLIQLMQNFDSKFPVHNVVLLVRSQLQIDDKSLGFEFEVDGGILTVNFKYIGQKSLNPDQVILCRRFQVALFKFLMDQKAENVAEVLGQLKSGDHSEIDYLLLPSKNDHLIDWLSVSSVLFSRENAWKYHMNCNARMIQTKSGELCSCMIETSLVCTPHNGHAYVINGFLNNLNANSLLTLRNGSAMTYDKYFELQHGIKLRFSETPFLAGRHIFTVHNYLRKSRKQKEKESSNPYVELPPELCEVIMSPISITTFYSFTFLPSIMYRLESLLLATNLKNMQRDHCVQNVVIPTMKVLEAITTKKCQENFHLESLETLGDSFLKYAVCQQLFKKHQNHHQGLLSIRKDKIVSNTALCALGCHNKLPGFIRDEPFDPKTWMIPGYNSESYILTEETLSGMRRIYVSGRRKVKSKKVADVVEALIGAYISTGGEAAGILFMNWMGMNVDFAPKPYERNFQVHADKLLNVRHLEFLLNYSFNDSSLLVEALTHGSYMLAAIPGCYQRLEFLGDAVLDYLITLHLYNKYPGMLPGLLTDMRSASVNNDCYAMSAVKAGLHKHILHASQKLYNDIGKAVESCKEASMECTFGWEFETSFPKVLGDVVESLAGAIFVDSGYDKDTAFRSIRPLLDPMVTLETLRVHPVKELVELCQKLHLKLKKPIVSRENGMSCITIEVEGNERVFNHTSSASDRKMAKKLASKEVLKSLKASLSST